MGHNIFPFQQTHKGAFEDLMTHTIFLCCLQCLEQRGLVEDGNVVIYFLGLVSLWENFRASYVKRQQWAELDLTASEMSMVIQEASAKGPHNNVVK